MWAFLMIHLCDKISDARASFRYIHIRIEVNFFHLERSNAVNLPRFCFASGDPFQSNCILSQSWFREWPEFLMAAQDKILVVFQLFQSLDLQSST